MAMIPGEKDALAEFLKISLPEAADDSDVARLSIRDQTIFWITQFDTEVLNGGIIQWLGNPTGTFTNETLMAMERVGAIHTAELIRKSMAFFPSGQVPRDYGERWAKIDDLSPESISKIGALSDQYDREDDQIFLKLMSCISNL